MSRTKLKARDKHTRKMSKDGLIERNAATGEELRISTRETDIDYRQRDTAPVASHGSGHEQQSFSQVGKRTESNTPAGGKPASGSNHKPVNRHNREFQATEAARAADVSHSQAPDDDTPYSPDAERQPSAHTPQSAAQTKSTQRQAQKRAAARSFSQTGKQTTNGQNPLATSADKPPSVRQESLAAQNHHAERTDSALITDDAGKLRFSDDEAAPIGKRKRKLVRAEHQMDRANGKLERAQNQLPAKWKLRRTSVVDEKTSKAKRKLQFEKTPISKAEHLKGPLPLRPIKAAGNTAMQGFHRKMYQVEDENVGTKAAHRGEMVVEAGVRSALRFRKTAPYRKVAKLQRKTTKKSMKLTYQRTLAQNPKLKSNLLSRLWQKRKIKKKYAKAAREAQKAAKRAKKAGSVATQAVKAVGRFIIRHPILTLVLLLILAIIFIIVSIVGLFGSAGGGGVGAVMTSSYLAEDADIDNASVAYTEWETDLLIQVGNTESDWPGYDEYRYDIGDVSHNPYELMAYLTAVYQNFPYDAISGDMRTLFDEQYTLTYTPSVEIRYRTVTGNDPETGEETEELEPYEWHILTVTLTARSFSDIAVSHLNDDQFAHYALLLQTKGSRQYVGNPFDFNWLPYVTSSYGYRIHPVTGEKDLHRGVDIGLASGTPIKSAQDGTVTFAGYSGDYGNVVVIENAKGLVTKYAHCETILVSEGQPVSMGDVIATIGSTGRSTGPHLHFEVLKDGQYLNPLFFALTGDAGLDMPYYGGYGSAMGDGSYEALIAEAERHLGKPYSFGANGPDKFDCSSYICWIMRESGVWNIGRTTAQGLYNLCSPVPPSEAKPGDLIFFSGTYSTSNTVTHVGLYVGGTPPMMIHCGKPCQYARIDTSYWQSHFYSFARIPGGN